ncbi:MAG: histidine phosphatase family protein [bacterium]
MKFLLLLIYLTIPLTNFGIGLDDYRERPFGHILFIRHGLAPGFGDPDHFQLRQCDTQRNLDEQGRNQSRNLGKLLKDSGIPFDQVYSSQWCRCLETAELLNLGPVIEEPGLNSFFQGIVNQEETLTRLREKMKEIQTAGERVIMVTHYITISAITGKAVSSSGGVIYDIDKGKSEEIDF